MSTEINAIISQLYTGAKIDIFFETSSKRETFRKRLLSIKAEQDAALVLLLDEEKQTLRFEKTDDPINGGFKATVWLEKKTTGTIVWAIVEQGDSEE